MLDIHPETKTWIDAAKKGERPYAFTEVDETLTVLCVAVDQQGAVACDVRGRGFAQWKLVNGELRVRRKRLVVTVLPGGRIAWRGPELQFDRERRLVLNLSVLDCDPAMLYCREHVQDVAFEVEAEGIVALRSEVDRLQLESQFRVGRLAGSSDAAVASGSASDRRELAERVRAKIGADDLEDALRSIAEASPPAHVRDLTITLQSELTALRELSVRDWPAAEAKRHELRQRLTELANVVEGEGATS